MKKQTKIILGVVALVVAIAVLLGVYFATRPDTTQGAKALTIVVRTPEGHKQEQDNGRDQRRRGAQLPQAPSPADDLDDPSHSQPNQPKSAPLQQRKRE